MRELSAAQNARVECLAECIENLCIATSASAMQKVSGESHPKITEFMEASQAALRASLRQFLVPALHLVDDGPRQEYPANVPLDERVACGECHRHFICADTACPHWHKAIRDTIARATGLDEDDEGDAA